MNLGLYEEEDSFDERDTCEDCGSTREIARCPACTVWVCDLCRESHEIDCVVDNTRDAADSPDYDHVTVFARVARSLELEARICAKNGRSADATYAASQRFRMIACALTPFREVVEAP